MKCFVFQISRGYNETVTMFYTHTIADAISKSDPEEDTFEEFIARNKFIQAKDFLFKYYSPQAIESEEASSRYSVF